MVARLTHLVLEDCITAVKIGFVKNSSELQSRIMFFNRSDEFFRRDDDSMRLSFLEQRVAEDDEIRLCMA
ncbi:hypothetical protein ACHQM5_011313 [Ranunculus cassubicifolius]